MLLRPAVGPLGIAVGDQDALPAFEVEADFKLARRALVNGGGERIRNRPHVLGVDARPHDMPVRAAVLLVLDHKARLAGEAEILFERVNRLAPLRRRQLLVGARIDVGLVEIILALGAGGESLHFAEGVGDGLGAEAGKLDDLDALVLLGVLKMLRPPSAGAAAAAVDDDRHGLDAEFRQDRLAQFPVRGMGCLHRGVHLKQFGDVAKIVAVHAAREAD